MTPQPGRLSVSVYVTSYNQLHYLREAIASVLTQTRLPDELLIVDDGSSDGSVEWLRELEREHPSLVRLLHDGENRGVGAVRRLAVEACTGELITYVDGDDTFLPGKLEREAVLLEADPSLVGVYSDFMRIDQDGHDLGAWAGPAAENLPAGDLFDRVVTRDFPNGTVFRSELVRRAVLLECDPYPPGLNLYEDYDAKLRLTRKGPFACVPEVLHTYRTNPDGLSRVESARHFRALQRVYGRNEHLLDGLETDRARSLQASVSRRQSRLAWRAVKEERASKEHGRVGRVLGLAGAAARTHPGGVRPKHVARVVRGVLGL